jgi:hypothetical protein
VARATMRFFVPAPSRKVFDEYMESHHEDVIAIATYLSDYQVGHSAIDSLSAQLRASFVHNRAPSKTSVVNDELLQRFLLTEHSMYKARVDVRRIVARMAAAQDVRLHEISIPLVAKEIATMPQNAQRARLQTAFLFEAASSAPEIARRMQALIEEVLHDREQNDRAVVDAELDFKRKLHAFVAEIAREWSHLTTMSWSADVVRVLSEFTGVDADRIKEQIRRRALPKPHRHEVAQAVSLFWHRRGTWPKRNSGSASSYGMPGFTWRDIDEHWGSYNLPGQSLEEYGRDHARGR